MENMALHIRAYNAATDLEKLSTIWLDASLSGHAFIGENRLRGQRKLVETHYLPAAETWVACRSGEPVGFVSLMANFIGGLFVAPHQQGQGTGRALVAHAFEGRDQLLLEVYTDNAQALAFYKALGFAELSRRATDDEGLPFETAQMRLKR
ncbi:GNAT family N-acetyltransferase [uncultured Roseobacter sp.]|uniref:GNAT family N-acetyltransferase n=1 Tax=uncultured Roseobacter sp. TaxID=114847 RepID=UPI002626D819|nr:GNAT family N-acetyltransferase [uncultured Roseobacter sp.]